MLDAGAADHPHPVAQGQLELRIPRGQAVRGGVGAHGGIGEQVELALVGVGPLENRLRRLASLRVVDPRNVDDVVRVGVGVAIGGPVQRADLQVARGARRPELMAIVERSLVAAFPQIVERPDG